MIAWLGEETEQSLTASSDILMTMTDGPCISRDNVHGSFAFVRNLFSVNQYSTTSNESIRVCRRPEKPTPWKSASPQGLESIKLWVAK